MALKVGGGLPDMNWLAADQRRAPTFGSDKKADGLTAAGRRVPNSSGAKRVGVAVLK
ncbi:hypothetical protein hamaS1_04730 [Moorella sp. Hama-1]|nr:hypothetical protein hamaS1_04730 [Moorella sp. Hama-1]